MRAYEVVVNPQVPGSLEEDKVSRGNALAPEHRLDDDPVIGVREDASIRERPSETPC
jgi:hypothetical protein